MTYIDQKKITGCVNNDLRKIGFIKFVVIIFHHHITDVHYL